MHSSSSQLDHPGWLLGGANLDDLTVKKKNATIVLPRERNSFGFTISGERGVHCYWGLQELDFLEKYNFDAMAMMLLVSLGCHNYIRGITRKSYYCTTGTRSSLT